jgi:hypothetical protein
MEGSTESAQFTHAAAAHEQKPLESDVPVVTPKVGVAGNRPTSAAD